MWNWFRRRSEDDSFDHLRAAREGHPHLGAKERMRGDTNVVAVLAAVALAVAVGLWFYSKDREMVSSDGTTVKTTGSGSSELPLPNAPTLPAPSPPQQ
jgi:hypothetical protein